MGKSWYVLNTFIGQESKVEKIINQLIESKELHECVDAVKVPYEDVIEVKDGARKIIKKKILPGYVLIFMELPLLGWKEICNKINHINGVSGFLGTVGGGKPNPISDDEVRNIFEKMGQIKTEKIFKMKEGFKSGEKIKIIDGAFIDFDGTIEEVDSDRMLLKVNVEIFGRQTIINLNFMQVEKID